MTKPNSRKKPPLGQLRSLTFDRAGHRCEALYPTFSSRPYRCRNQADELQHVLPRGRGGTLLDREANVALKDGTFNPSRHLAHLLALCHTCHHEVAHGQPVRANDLRLAVRGDVRTGLDGTPVYTGPDELLSRLWPPTSRTSGLRDATPGGSPTGPGSHNLERKDPR